MNLEQTNKVIKAFEKEIKRLLKLGKSPKEAVRAAYKKFPVMETLREELEAQIIAEMARGSEYAFPAEALAAAAAKPWAEDGLTLSDRTTKGSKAVVSHVTAAIGNCIKENQTTYATSRKLFDGYQKDGIIPEQDIPNFMHSLIRAAQPDMRRSAEFKRVLRNATRNVEKLTTQGMKAAYNQITEAILTGNEKRLEKAVYVATQERTRYFAERIARTELARAYHDGVTARWDNDPDCVAYQWRMSQSHPVTDICDLYAGADLYGMGAGVFPKGKVPELPAHPHCMCYLRPLMSGSLKLKSETPKERIDKGGREWLDKQSKYARQCILGVKGESQYKKGANWRNEAKGYSERKTKSRIAIPAGNDKIKSNKKSSNGTVDFVRFDEWQNLSKNQSIEECAKYANPNYNKGEGYQFNCVMCVAAYEMQRRGKMAIARPAKLPLITNDTAIEWERLFNGGEFKQFPGTGKKYVEDYLKAIWGNGSRAMVYVNWRYGEYGHVFVVENVKGKLIYIDPQNGLIGAEVEEYFKHVSHDTTRMMRIDNLTFNDKHLNDCCENPNRKGKKNG